MFFIRLSQNVTLFRFKMSNAAFDNICNDRFITEYMFQKFQQ